MIKPLTTGVVSFREAREQIHRQYVAALMEIEFAVTAKQREKLRMETSRKRFVESCCIPAAKFNKVVADLDLEANSSDGDEAIDTRAYEVELKKIYKATTERIGQAISEKVAKVEKESLFEEKAKEKVIRAGPSSLLNHAVDQRLDSKLAAMGLKTKKKGKTNDDDLPANFDYSKLTTQTMMGGALPEAVDEFRIPSAPKNGQSPAVMAGAKNKGKGKNPHGKAGKGKGKGSKNAPGKDNKGKGKNKSSPTIPPRTGKGKGGKDKGSGRKSNLQNKKGKGSPSKGGWKKSKNNAWKN